MSIVRASTACSLDCLLAYTERRIQHWRRKLSATRNIVKRAEYRGRLAELEASLTALHEIARRAA